MLTTKEISQALNVSEETVRRWIRQDELKATQEGKSYLISQDDLETFLKEKSKSNSSIVGKLGSLGLATGQIGGILGGVTYKLFNNLQNKSTEKIIKNLNNQDSSQSIQDLENLIQDLERKKKKAELEHQMLLLDIEDQITKYQRAINELKKSD